MRAREPVHIAAMRDIVEVVASRFSEGLEQRALLRGVICAAPSGNCECDILGELNGLRNRPAQGLRDWCGLFGGLWRGL